MLGQPPSLATERLEPRVVVYWYLTDLVRTAVLCAMLVVGAHVWEPSKRHDWIEPLAWSLAGALLLVTLVAPPLAYARWRFGVDDRWLAMRYGILFVEDRRVPVPQPRSAARAGRCCGRNGLRWRQDRSR